MVIPQRSLAAVALLLAISPSLSSAASNLPHYADLRGGQTLAATSNASVTSSTLLDLVDVTLNAPKNAVTCDSVDITWEWDMNGTPPSDPIAVSIIDASTLGAVATPGSRRRFASARHGTMIKKRAASVRGTVLPGAASIPFNEVSYSWSPVKIQPGSYRLLLTILSSGESVVSDPFPVGRGSTACFSSSPTAASSSAASPLATSSSSSNAEPAASSSDAEPSASSITAPAATDSSSSPSSSPSQASASSSDHHSNKAAIAAGVAIPLLLIAVLAYAWRLWKKQKSEQADSVSSRPAWAEKFFGGGSSSGSIQRQVSPSQSSGHRREISGPGLATPAGLAAVAGMVPVELRKEKDEMALRAVPPPNVPYSPDMQDLDDRPEHWINFSDNDVRGAQPLSAAVIAESARDSGRLTPYDNSGKPAGLYGQGRNVPLRPESSQCPSSSGSISTFGNDPRRASAASGVSIGRDLIAALPQPPSHKHSVPSSSAHSISPFADPPAPAPEDLAQALTQHQEGNKTVESSVSKPSVQRSDSSGSSFGVRRKPVPRISVAGTSSSDSKVAGDGEGPFGNEHAIELVPDTDEHRISMEASTSIPIQSVADARAPSPIEQLTVPRENAGRASDDAQAYHLSVARQSGFDVSFTMGDSDK
ncbi:hypothetical protein BDZ90DRAFT_259335 [Jaminaea rosea]|uniref:Uncharacterized protein n=1 Tax=Jaminaea rosea TaxID=1569628 RepID=A0A316USK1_9BASI|nr:hypothetical protein BDZ90DRAFT_259335 [Jaminaea rosea]PWN28279.1 hypothetical protein BDZ90DRAFT_259335 [Jaminaea rosea]